MRSISLISAVILVFALFSCDNGSVSPIDEPDTYDFQRNGSSSVSFTGQTTRIQMAEELAASLKDFDNASTELLLEMFRNETESGDDADPYSSADLNASDKSIKSKVAASQDYYSSNTAESAVIKADFESWINAQVNEVFPAQNVEATAGTAGQIADGSSARYINAKGLEYDQMVIKGLIGALMTDQALNNYLGTAVLDEGNNREDNDNGVLVEGKNYTNMEHKWDEAYGYLYGTSVDPADPNATIGGDDSFLNKYIGRAEGDEDFAGIAAEIYNAFKLGRAAIVAGDYTLRDEQAEIIKEKVSEIIGIRAVYYLQQAKFILDQSNPDYGAAFHDLSEGYGFIYSLMFTRKPNTDAPYFTKSEVDALIAKLLGDGENGLWDVTPTTLDELSSEIADAFKFTVEQAGS
ncbi:MAG: DUF4856 domain-containing protein [Bacteroidia bacterium]|nr:DUF4856 domain-containing protein [Bacteroidia bacterium]